MGFIKKIWFFVKRILIPFAIVFFVTRTGVPEAYSPGFDTYTITSTVYIIVFLLMWNLWRSQASDLEQHKKNYMKSVQKDPAQGALDKAFVAAAVDEDVSFQKAIYVISLLFSPIAYFGVIADGAGIGNILFYLFVYVVTVVIVGGFWNLIS